MPSSCTICKRKFLVPLNTIYCHSDARLHKSTYRHCHCSTVPVQRHIHYLVHQLIDEYLPKYVLMLKVTGLLRVHSVDAWLSVAKAHQFSTVRSAMWDCIQDASRHSTANNLCLFLSMKCCSMQHRFPGFRTLFALNCNFTQCRTIRYNFERAVNCQYAFLLYQFDNTIRFMVSDFSYSCRYNHI
jgi:hypothetical protein